jgi:uncharacterized protein (DUF58 family)
MEGFLDSLDTLSARQFFIAVRKLADDLSYGTDRSTFLGSGIEYVQSRPYQWGDPIRAVDWRVTARTGRVHVKEYEAPKRMPCYLLMDTSASMTVSSVKLSKYALAVHLAGGIAFACLDRVSPVGVLGIGGRDLRIEPSLSRDTVMLWLHQLRRYRFDEPTTMSRRLAELGTLLPSRVMIVILSDMHDPKGLSVLKQLAQRHDCVVLQLADPAEQGITAGGFVRGQEAETGQRFVSRWANVRSADYDLSGELRRSGIDYLRIQTDRPFVARLRQFFKGRNLLGRGTR